MPLGPSSKGMKIIKPKNDDEDDAPKPPVKPVAAKSVGEPVKRGLTVAGKLPFVPMQVRASYTQLLRLSMCREQLNNIIGCLGGAPGTDIVAIMDAKRNVDKAMDSLYLALDMSVEHNIPFNDRHPQMQETPDVE